MRHHRQMSPAEVCRAADRAARGARRPRLSAETIAQAADAAMLRSVITTYPVVNGYLARAERAEGARHASAAQDDIPF